MELALTVLIWIAATGLLIFIIGGAVHLSVKTDLLQSKAQRVRAQTRAIDADTTSRFGAHS